MAAVTRCGPTRPSSSTRPNQAVVNLDAVRFNTRTVLRSVEPAAVRADAYGHGALEVAGAAMGAGAIGAANTAGRGLGLVQSSCAAWVAVNASREVAVRTGSSSMGVCPRPGSISTLAPGTAR